METEILVVPQEMSFEEIMNLHGFEGKIPSNSIVNKRIPGIGATYNEIMSSRHSIIIVPFTAIIEVKKLKHGDDLQIVFGQSDLEKTIEEIIAYLDNPMIRWKKIMTTPESFYKVKLALLKQNPNYINDFFCLIDECDVLVHDALFRTKMLEVMPEFFAFKHKSMISATPIIPSDSEFETNGFKYVILNPTYLIKPKLSLIATNNINASLRERIQFLNSKDDKPIMVFTNCKRSIAYLVNLKPIKDDFKVFCTQELNEKFFKQNGIINICTSVGLQQYAKYNFFTSKFFSGVDFFLPKHSNPHVIIVSNIKETPHSIISPKSTAVQIYGRSRNGVTSTTHITSTLDNCNHMDEADLKSSIDNKIYFISELNRINKQSYERTTIKVLDDIVNKDSANVIIRKDGTVDPYLKDNVLYNLITRNLYCSADALLKSYVDGDFFKPTLHIVYKPFTEEDLNKLKKFKGGKKAHEILKQLEDLIERYGKFNIAKDHEDYYRHLDHLSKEDSLIYESYFLLGSKIIRELKFNRTKLRNEIFNRRKGDKKNYMRMIDEVLIKFLPMTLGSKYPLYIDVIENELNAIYKQFQYERKPGKIAKASATDIEEYFSCKRINGKKKVDGVYKTYYILYDAKFQLSNESKQLQ